MWAEVRSRQSALHKLTSVAGGLLLEFQCPAAGPLLSRSVNRQTTTATTPEKTTCERRLKKLIQPVEKMAARMCSIASIVII
ncbi:uncharacterized protein Dsimw501_GD29282 [Drosophila simulans]|uniref:Uncharacterized protein n=1 Tax=Drosophila simulans TaxID=7240 RepID=A0A0J9R1Z4_DROSI|nr:uncharacterized protein Dsimw501_GD29282 [Drosophila simulans]